MRSSRSQMFFKIDVLRNFAEFTGKHQLWSLFLIKLQTWRSAKRLQYKCFPVNIAKFLRAPLLQNTCCIIMKFYKDICSLFFLTDWRHMGRKDTIEIFSVINFFISPGWAETITWENFILAKRNPGCMKEGSRLVRMKRFTCNCRM